MLRQVFRSTALARRVSAATQQQRLYAAAAAATSREKRGLSASQIKGEGSGKKVAEAAPPTSGGGGGGGVSMPAVLGVLAIGGAGAAYAMDLIPGLSSEEAAPVKETSVKEEEPAPEPAPEAKKEETPKVVEEEAPKEEEPSEEAAPATVVTGNRVTEISLPKGTGHSEPPPAVIGHPLGGNKVEMKPVPVTENTPTVDAALKELQSDLAKETSKALGEAHKELAKLVSLDLSEIDSLSATQLKIRLVQMAKDLEERTKWEAVRLKEFLAMKEKEVEDKHIILMKKQQQEAEVLMEKKLREQKEDLTSKAEKALKEKEDALQELIDHSIKIQEQAYEEEKASFEKRTEEAANAKFEELYGKSLAEAKQGFAKKMEQRTKQMEALTKKLSELEFALQTSKDFESGSVQAHRMSAAAIALIDRLESAEPAGAAMEALKAIASENAVISAALSSLPPSVATKGVASLQELQTYFEEKVHKKCRQAANVPEGQAGIEGQLLGMMVATLKFPPGPDDPAPESEKDTTEYVLARARRHVQLGELEQATEQMEKLTGQPAFTARDWTQQAKERVAVEKALKVIRIECALANDSMSKSASA